MKIVGCGAFVPLGKSDYATDNKHPLPSCMILIASRLTAGVDLLGDWGVMPPKQKDSIKRKLAL